MQAPAELRRTCDAILRSRHPQILPFLAPSFPRSFLRGLGAPSSATRRASLSTDGSAISSRRSSTRHPTSQAILGSTRRNTTFAKTPPLDPKNGPELNERIRAQYEKFNSFKDSAEMLREAYAEEMFRDDSHAKSDSLKALDKQINTNLLNPDTLSSTVRRYDPQPARASAKANSNVEIKFPKTPGRSEAQSVTEDIARNIVTLPNQFHPRRTVRSRPTVGMTIEVNPEKGVDFARSLGLLKSRINRSKLPQMSRNQKYHERPGLKRKRLKSERWRRYFKQGFDAMVTRVKQMKAQGW